MKETQINFTKNPDRTYTIINVPVGQEFIDVTLRTLTFRDKQWIASNQNDPELTYKIFSELIVKWGEKDFISCDELASLDNAHLYDEALSILDSFLEQTLLSRYKFIPLKQ